MKLAERVALITGAFGGIGRATALALAEEGADIALNDIESAAGNIRLAEDIKLLGRRVIIVPADVSDQKAAEDMVARTSSELGRLDVYVSCAAYSAREPFLSADMADFRRTIDVTMWGAFHGLRASANQMLKQSPGDSTSSRGSCILISSTLAIRPIPGSMAYNMAKAAVDQMARTAASELAPHRIRVNVMHPGWVDTPGEQKFFKKESLVRMGHFLPWGRLALPEEIARGVVFLADPQSDYITGSTLTIDGGMHLPPVKGRTN